MSAIGMKVSDKAVYLRPKKVFAVFAQPVESVIPDSHGIQDNIVFIACLVDKDAFNLQSLPKTAHQIQSKNYRVCDFILISVFDVRLKKRPKLFGVGYAVGFYNRSPISVFFFFTCLPCLPKFAIYKP